MARFFVQLVAADRSEALELHAGRPLVVGRQLLGDESIAERHLTVSVHENEVVVEELRGATGTTLNDVQLSGQTPARPGDEIGVGRARLIVMAQADAPARTVRLGSHDELMARLDDELERAALHRPVVLALVAMPPLNTPARLAMLRRLAEGVSKLGAQASWAEFAADVVAAVVPELSPEARAELAQRLPALAGPRARVAVAVSPVDGLDAEGLLEVALERLGASVEIERVVVDPAMVRLTDAAERLARSGGSVRIEGPSGAGRVSLARALLDGQGPVVHALDAAALQATRGQVRVVREAGLLAAPELSALLDEGRLVATVGFGQHASLFVHSLRVPALVDRPDDILPLAESFLSAERRLLARPRLSLGTQARGLLGRYRWPGNVRELRNVMARAARSSVRDEIGADALPARLTHEVPAENLRGALKSAERELLLESLARTRWNVTAAAARLGLPRRTVVYRMAKLGLKRPAR